MAAESMDAISSFRYVIENVPTWSAQVKCLSDTTSAKHLEFVNEYTRLVKQIRPKRIKSSSMTSIQSGEQLNDEVPQSSPSPNEFDNKDHKQRTTLDLPDRVDIDPLEAGNKYLYAQAQRKRKPGTSIRSGASGPQNFRTKTQVVIYYDGDVQMQFDSLLKAVGLARNNLRKGKNAFTMAKGFQLPSLSRRYESPSAMLSTDNTRNLPISRSSPMLLSSKTSPLGQRQVVTVEEAAFTETDKCLESVQSLCETAAHQFLRDGDCRMELDNMIRELNNSLAKAQSTVALLERQKEEEGGTMKQTQDNTPQLTSSDSSEAHTPNSEATLVSTMDSNAMDSNLNKLAPTMAYLSNTVKNQHLRNDVVINSDDAAIQPLTSMEIEVDDEISEISDVLVDMKSYRLGNPLRYVA